MIRLGSDVLRIEALYILAAALSYALFLLTTRHLARTESTPAIVFYTTGLAPLSSLPVASTSSAERLVGA